MDGRRREFELTELEAPMPGPTVALLGGIHGDEEEGVLAVQRVCTLISASKLTRGSVRAVPVAHPAAYAANQRRSPLDGRDLARCFPGDPSGSATQRLAHDLTDNVIRGCDLLIDLHSAGTSYIMPTFVGYVHTSDDTASRARRAAFAFGAPLVWEHAPPPPPGRSVSVGVQMGIPSIYVEGSGGGSLEHTEVAMYVDGILRVLADLKMTSVPIETRCLPTHIIRGGDGDLDAGVVSQTRGRFVGSCDGGQLVRGGDVIGEIVDTEGTTTETITAPTEGTVIFLRRRARISAGEVIFRLAPPAVPWIDQ